MRTWYFILNPVAIPIDAVRWSFLGAGHLNLGWLAYAGAASVAVFAIGLMVFHSFEREFADVI